MANYYLMHRNDICGKFTYDEISGRISSYHDMENGLSPFLGNSNLKNTEMVGNARDSCLTLYHTGNLTECKLFYTRQLFSQKFGSQYDRLILDSPRRKFIAI